MDGSKFVGGAALARKRARQVKYHPPLHTHTHKKKNRKNGHNHHNQNGGGHPRTHLRLPNKVNASTRFFASLLSSSVHDIVQVQVQHPGREGTKNQNHSNESAVMSDICQRAGIPLPSPLSDSNGGSERDKHHFFASRASLVMEEARCILAEGLPHHHRDSRTSRRRKYPMHVELVNVKMDKHGFGNLMFQKIQKPNHRYGQHRHSYERGRSSNDSANPHTSASKAVPFTTSEMFDMKPGCVMELTWQDQDPNVSNSTTGGTSRPRSILTNIIPSSDFDHRTAVLLMAYRMDDLERVLALGKDGVSFQLIPVTNLISEQRQFMACYYPPKVEFMSKLVGMKSATHLRFDDSDDSDESHEDEQNEQEESDQPHDSSNSDSDPEEKKMDNDCDALDTSSSNNIPDRLPQNDEISMTAMNIPMLNPTQEHAATSFLHGPSHNLSLVQGPPGTGKTTFMTAVLCRTFLVNYNTPDSTSTSSSNPSLRYSKIDRDKRVLVAAPTNKAISVLASRFMRATRGNSDTGLNVVLVGVEDALFPKEDEGEESLDDAHQSLKGIFVYTWIEEMVKDLETLRFVHGSIPSLNEVEDVFICAQYLVEKMKRSLPSLSKKYGSIHHGTAFLKCLEHLHYHILSESELKGEQDDKSFSLAASSLEDTMNLANDSLGQIILCMKEMRSGDDCVVSELLATANIIFVTLTSSGGSIMKRSRRVDELFVDEAAAATEPEIFIPLHFRPRRMLCVGDPKQLPASVTSQRAAKFGLDKSLLDRLMFGCGKDHVMLDIQYRMAPPISEFPSSMFYDGKLLNGGNVTNSAYKSTDEPILNGDPYTFIQVNGQESRSGTGSFYNTDEARVVVRLVERLRDASNSRSGESWASKDNLRIITFYSGQVSAIKNLLRSKGLGRVMVATVDSSQGCESNNVIVSFVRCQGVSLNKGLSTVGFLNDSRRINVAITRAKYRLFCIGDATNTLSRSNSSTVSNLVENAAKRNLILHDEIR